MEACSALWRARASTEGSRGGEGGAADEVDDDDEDATIDDDKRRLRAHLATAVDAVSLLPMLAGQHRDVMAALSMRGSIIVARLRRR